MQISTRITKVTGKPTGGSLENVKGTTGADLDVLRQSHSHLIIKEYVCARPLKPYIA